MKINLVFYGAAQNVTGSRFLVEVNGRRILVDCGLYQERQLRARNWDPFPVPPKDIDAVLLTHAHLDHCGLLPKLVREGFRGRIYCTAATAEIAQIVLMDSAHIQEEDAEFKRRRHEREGRKGPYPEVPLYTSEDAAAVESHFKPVAYAAPTDLGDGLTAVFHDAGHILGSAMIQLTAAANGDRRSILFSGDVGRWDKPIVRDPTLIDQADYVLVESTYGDRLHESRGNVEDGLAEVVNETVGAGGNVIIPSFALERAQEVLYHLNDLLIAKRIGDVPVYLDSPMAISVTEVFAKHPEMFDEEMTQRLRGGQSPFDLPGLKMSRTTDESKAINHLTDPALIIAGSGMCTGGRIKHHLVNNITQRENTVLFVGYQAVGTLGRHIVDGAEEVRIHGRQHIVEARIARLYGFSAHADRDELMRWLGGLKQAPRQVFVVHGEPASAAAFREHLAKKTGWDATVPSYQDRVQLD